MFNCDQKIYMHLCVHITQYEICYVLFIAGNKSAGVNLTFVDVINLIKLPRAPPICLLKILLSILKVGLVN